jgi:hypothetical protein
MNYTYSVCPLSLPSSELGPPAPSPTSECVPPLEPKSGGGQHSLVGEGAGEPIRKTFLAPKWPSLALRAIEGAKKVLAPFGRQDFHCPPLQLGRVMGFPPKNNYIPQHLQNGYINS